MPRLRRYAGPLVLACAIGAGFVIAPHMPHDHRVDLRLDDAASVTSVELAWAHEVPSADDPLHGASWRFDYGKAPTVLGTHVSLPNGRYALDVMVERGAERDAIHRVITLGDDDHISVRVK